MGNCEAVTNSSDSALPLRITQRQMYDAVHICVVRDTQELVISLSNGKWGTVRINGEIASVDQGRDLLRELTNASSKEEFPRFGVRDKKTQKVYYEPEFETAHLWRADFIELTSQVLEADLTIRKILTCEFGSIVAIA